LSNSNFQWSFVDHFKQSKERAMKPAKQHVVTILIACASLCLMSEASFAEPAGYQLVVRGGENIHPQIKRVSSDRVDLIVDFKFGTKPVGDGLSRGQGSWMDRGMRPGEPTRLIYRTSTANALYIRAGLGSPEKSWAFWCSSTNKGYMNVTSDVQAGGKKADRPTRID
jgi:hypothetical protein